ncbi:flagellin [Clostridium butyricum]|uniref:flagellin n=1 Tax=Clostridium butyricum TaxID=1492 RepID=UPI0013D23733|nr:flagellin [Clostridium butyricum]MCQ2022226.1 flagellin [Clostridium butyricum]NFB70079.1 flagellin [Clostridium butyricum]NFB89866.1 flagellin [Clostridium butyricum]
MRIGHNMYSLNILKNYKNTLGINSKALGNISTGVRLNSAKDNPNKIAQSDNLKLQLLAREAAQSNIQDTNSMLQTFDGALQEMNNNISRLSELTVKAANGTNSDEDLEVIQKEIKQIVDGLDDIAQNTSFNGVVLSISSSVGTDPEKPSATKTSVIGELSGEKVEIPFYDLSCKGIGIDKIDVTTTNGANKAIAKVDDATKIVSRIRSKYGALQSRLEDTNDSMSDINLNISNAHSSIADADIAEEMLNYARTNIMYQSAISLLAQSNKFPQDALNILSSVK